MRRDNAAGFTLVEVLLAAAVLSAALAIVMRLAVFGQATARVRPEAADQLQRLRVAVSMLQRDLALAGAGPLDGEAAGSLHAWLPPVLPHRTGAWSPDPELSFFSDRISILYVPAGGVAAPLSAATPTPTADLMVDAAAPGCPSAGACGMGVGSRVLVVDAGGLGRGFDLLSVRGLTPGLAFTAPDPPLSRLYDPPDARVMPVEQRVYWFDRAGRRLMLYDGSESDVPLVDEVVGLDFTWFLDGGNTRVRQPENDEGNCAYAPGAPPLPLLADLGSPSPSPASAPLLTDGPVCGLSPHRFDADLLRVRRIGVRLRVQVSDRTLRATGARFAVPGTSAGGVAAVPDVEVRFDVTLRNRGAAR